MTFSVNDTPLCRPGRYEGHSRQIGDRLKREAEGNVAIRSRQSEENDAFEVAGRGELQLAVLIETMRREGFEMSISRPRVLFQEGPNGERLEPVEEVTVDVDEEYSGIVVEKIDRPARRAQGHAAGRRRQAAPRLPRAVARSHRLFRRVPDRHARHGRAQPRSSTPSSLTRAAIAQRHTGVLIANELGASTAYALFNLEDRGPMFIGAGEKVYSGMIIGEHTRGNDLEVNRPAGEEAHQHPRRRQGRRHPPHPARSR